MGGCTVWVIGPDVEGQLAPYENAIERGYPYASSLYVDVLDYMKAVYLAGVKCICTVDATGKIYPPWDEAFPTNKIWSMPQGTYFRLPWDVAIPNNITMAGAPHLLPEGRRLKPFPAKDIMSFATWAKYFYIINTRSLARFKLVTDHQALGDLILSGPGSHNGWIRIEGGEQVVEWVSIPRAYWFNWNVGYDDGSGAFMLKHGKTGELKYRTGREVQGTSYSAKKGEIDFATMREEAMRGAVIAWDAHMALDAAIGRGANTPDQEVYKVLEAANIRDVYRFATFPREQTREEYIESHGNSAAKLNIGEYVLESRWYEPILMPYHPTFSKTHIPSANDLINSAVWRKRVDSLWNNLPDDTLITEVSCKV